VRRLFAPLAEEPRSEVLTRSAPATSWRNSPLRTTPDASEDAERAQAALARRRGIEQLDGDDVSELRHVVHWRANAGPATSSSGVAEHRLVPTLRTTGNRDSSAAPGRRVIASVALDSDRCVWRAPARDRFAIDVLRLHRALFAEVAALDARPLVTLRPAVTTVTMRSPASLRAAGSASRSATSPRPGHRALTWAVVDERRVKLGTEGPRCTTLARSSRRDRCDSRSRRLLLKRRTRARPCDRARRIARHAGW